MSDTTGEVLPSGLMTEQISDLKRRQRSVYYRRITVMGGEMVWVRTTLLPSDVQGRAYYLSKGFRLTPPEGTEFAVEQPAAKPETDRDATINVLMEEIKALKAELKANTVKKAGRKKRSL